MLGAGARLEPGDEHGFDLVVGRAGMLTLELRAPHGLAELAELEGGSQSRRHGVRGVISHDVIVGGSCQTEKLDETLATVIARHVSIDPPRPRWYEGGERRTSLHPRTPWRRSKRVRTGTSAAR